MDAVALDIQTNKSPPKYDRERHLVALPILGTRGGGGREYVFNIIIIPLSLFVVY